MWTSLQNLLDIKVSRPRQAEGIVSKEMMDGSGHHFMLKNSRTHTYARLSPEEHWIWQQFNGEKTVQQLVLDYFMEYKSFAFGAVTDLIRRLTELHMLNERPHHLYAGIIRELQKQTLAYKATWLARLAFTKEWSIKGLDSHLERIYKYGGWILFSLPLQIAFLLVSVIGTFLFLQISRDPQYALFGSNTGGTIVKLGLLAYIPLLIHEFGHAITAKHVGCEVYKGGAMLYYGLPAAFVDTTDVWMFGKQARLAVTWAGPYTGYILSGLSGLIVYFSGNLPVITATSILQIGMIGFFTSTMNILPLLKLDGYYILADWLEIPRLRERSMEFIVKGIRPKFSKREKWTREERIFLVFGLLAFLSTFYFTYSGIRYWDAKTTSSISTLLMFSGDFLEQLTNTGIVLLAISSIAYSLYLLFLRGSFLVKQLRRNGLLSHRGYSALVMIAGTVIMVAVPPVLLPTLAHWLMVGLGMFSFGVAVSMSYTNFQRMRGSVHAGMWAAGMIGFALGTVSFIGEIRSDWVVAGLSLFEAGLVSSILVFIFAGRLLRGLRGSWRSISLGTIALGSVAGVASLLIDAVSAKTFAGMLVFSGLLHWNMRPVDVSEYHSVDPAGESTRERMVQAFQHLRMVVLGELEKDYGRQTRKWVESGYYRKARFMFKEQKPDEAGYNSTMTGMTPGDYGAAMALSLEELLMGVEKAAGRRYAARALAYGFDSLDWEQQEITEDYILKYVKRAERLSQQMSDTRHDVEAFLRSVPLFMSMDDKDIIALSKQLKSKRFNRGDTIFQQDDEGDAFYLIRAGSVEVVHRFDVNRIQDLKKNAILGGDKDQVMIVARNRKMATLGHGDTFGEAALLTGEKRNATIRALTPVEVLWLGRKNFDKFVRDNINIGSKVRARLQRLSVLKQIPIFSEFDKSTLIYLESKLDEVSVNPGEIIFKYGEDGNHFYIIESGKVSVSVPYFASSDETQVDERASLGSGEYFGEMSLLMEMPRTATIVAIKPTKLLRLDSQTFNELLDRSKEMKEAVGRASSRRQLSNERWARSLPSI